MGQRPAHVLRGESTVDELLRVVDVPPEEERAPAGAGPQEPARQRGRRAGRAARSRPRRPASARRRLRDRSARASSCSRSRRRRRSGPHGARPARKVLLVDDEDSLRKVIKDLLERDGYDVSEARDGVQALDQVDRVGPDIIVLDLNLPGLDGYGVLSHLRSRPATAGIPVIVLTAKGDEDNEVRVFELGADDFLPETVPRARSLGAARSGAGAPRARPPVTAIRVCFVDTLVLRGAGERLEVLVLRRAPRRSQPRIVGNGPWHDRAGRDAGAGSRCASCAKRPGLAPERFYNLSRIEGFYQHRTDELAIIPAFAAFVAADAAPRSPPSTTRSTGCVPADAARRFAWPRERRALDDVLSIVGAGGGGLLDDVLRVS